MLLPDDESGELDELAKDCYNLVRWDFSSEQARLAKWTANKISENIAKTMAQNSALSHVEYQSRKGICQTRRLYFSCSSFAKMGEKRPEKIFPSR